jgi:hypothetical protein
MTDEGRGKRDEGRKEVEKSRSWEGERLEARELKTQSMKTPKIHRESQSSYNRVFAPPENVPEG